MHNISETRGLVMVGRRNSFARRYSRGFKSRSDCSSIDIAVLVKSVCISEYSTLVLKLFTLLVYMQSSVLLRGIVAPFEADPDYRGHLNTKLDINIVFFVSILKYFRIDHYRCVQVTRIFLISLTRYDSV